MDAQEAQSLSVSEAEHSRPLSRSELMVTMGNAARRLSMGHDGQKRLSHDKKKVSPIPEKRSSQTQQPLFMTDKSPRTSAQMAAHQPGASFTIAASPSRNRTKLESMFDSSPVTPDPDDPDGVSSKRRTATSELAEKIKSKLQKGGSIKQGPSKRSSIGQQQKQRHSRTASISADSPTATGANPRGSVSKGIISSKILNMVKFHDMYNEINTLDQWRTKLFDAVTDGDEKRVTKLVSYYMARPHQAFNEPLNLDTLRDSSSNKNSVLHVACRCNQFKVASLLIWEHGVNPLLENNYQSTPLHFAASSGSNECLVLLLEHPVVQREGKDRRDFYGFSPLHLAVLNGHRQAAELLLHGNASVELPVRNAHKCCRALHFACERWDMEMARVLIEHGGANLHPRDDDANTPLMRCIIKQSQLQSFPSTPSSALSTNLGSSRQSFVLPQHVAEQLRQQQSSNGNATDHAKQVDMYRFMLQQSDHKSLVAQKQKRCAQNLVHLAAEHGDDTFLRLLFETLPQDQIVQLLLAHCEYMEFTPLHFAAKNGHVKIVELIVERLIVISQAAIPGGMVVDRPPSPSDEDTPAFQALATANFSSPSISAEVAQPIRKQHSRASFFRKNSNANSDSSAMNYFKVAVCSKDSRGNTALHIVLEMMKEMDDLATGQVALRESLVRKYPSNVSDFLAHQERYLEIAKKLVMCTSVLKVKNKEGLTPQATIEQLSLFNLLPNGKEAMRKRESKRASKRISIVPGLKLFNARDSARGSQTFVHRNTTIDGLNAETQQRQRDSLTLSLSTVTGSSAGSVSAPTTARKARESVRHSVSLGQLFKKVGSALGGKSSHRASVALK